MADQLNGFDMVLALTEGAVNAQFETAFKDGYIDPDRAILPPEVKWDIPNGRGTIKAALGAPTVSFMPNNNNYQNATFILTLVKGQFDNYSIDTTQSPPAVVTNSKPINNWKVGFIVDLKKMAFGAKVRDAALEHGALNEQAHAKLSRFSDDLFDINALIFDFASANIAAFDSHHTSLPGLSADEQLSLANALTVYFTQERKKPFIIGIHATSKNPDATAQGVAPTLVPTGVTYTTFGNASQPPQGSVGSLSTLNYLVSTDNHAPAPAIPNGVFRTPIVTDNDASGQLLISRAAFVENFILKSFGRHLGSGFTTSSPRQSVSVVNKPGINWHKDGSFTSPGSANTVSSLTITTTASLSANSAEIVFNGTISTKAAFTFTFIWSGTWTVWKDMTFSGKISILPSQDTHTLELEFRGFTFGSPQITKNDKDAGAEVDNILSFGTINQMMDALLNNVSSELEGWAASVLSAGQAALPIILIPPTGDNYALSPLHFNDSGDLVVKVNFETR